MWNSCHKAPCSQAESSENCSHELLILINHQDLKCNICTNLYRDPHMTPTHIMHYCIIYIHTRKSLWQKYQPDLLHCLIPPQLGSHSMTPVFTILYQSLISLLGFFSNYSLCLETPKLDALVRHKVLKTSRLSVIESTPDLLCMLHRSVSLDYIYINMYMRYIMPSHVYIIRVLFVNIHISYMTWNFHTRKTFEKL